MALEDYEREMNGCIRCSLCKFMPLALIGREETSDVCPAVWRHGFHTYSGGGRVIAANSVRLGRSELSDELVDIIYRCQMCGACDIPCHTYGQVVEPLQIARELRMKCVEEGLAPLEAMVTVDNLGREDNPFGEPKAERGSWADGLDVRGLDGGKAEVLLHVGCRYSYDESLRPVIRTIAGLLQKAGVDFRAALSEEACCGGRAFDLGYRGEIEKYADDLAGRVRAVGATKLVTPCGDCYPTIERALEGVEILHVSQLIEQLRGQGVIEPQGEVPKLVTYHDPCHLGRLGEAYEHWKGEYHAVGGILVPEPDKPKQVGGGGVYDAPRALLRSIPGIELVEMDRIRQYSWCCGAGGGVLESDPDFACATALERIREARSTGAEAIVTSCPWCVRNLRDAQEGSDDVFEVFDVLDILEQSLGLDS